MDMPVLVTTSRRPTRRSRRFVKELCKVIPYFHKINRGRMGYKDIREYMIRKGYTRLILVENYKGNPSVMEFLLLDELFLRRVGGLRIKSLSLQVDTKADIEFSSLKKVIYQDVDEAAKELLSLFFYPYYGAHEGVEGHLIIKGGEFLVFKFYNDKNKVVPPYIEGRLTIYE